MHKTTLIGSFFPEGTFAVLLWLLSIFAGTNIATADDTVNTETIYYRSAQSYILDRSVYDDRYSDEFRSIVTNLSGSSREKLFEESRLNPVPGMLLNAAMPGLGSLVIGDYITAAVVGSAMTLAVVSLAGLAYWDLGGLRSDNELVLYALASWSWLGGVVFTYGYGVLSPLWFTANRNNRLREILSITDPAKQVSYGRPESAKSLCLRVDVFQITF